MTHEDAFFILDGENAARSEMRKKQIAFSMSVTGQDTGHGDIGPRSISDVSFA